MWVRLVCMKDQLLTEKLKDMVNSLIQMETSIKDISKTVDFQEMVRIM